jgi:Tol biopolymer transport system component
MGYPRWSPDGTTILFGQQTASGNLALWTLQPGGESRQLTSFGTGIFAFEANSSPDGSQIVFKKYVGGADHDELHVMSADGASDRTLWIGDQSTAERPDRAP